ncbi:MAG: hypothetical protein AB7U81_10765 [Thiohalomonadaceae bacterium]
MGWNKLSGRAFGRAAVTGGLLLAAGAVQAGVSVGAGIEYFYWREYDGLTNEELLDETGPRAVATLELSAGVARMTDLLVRGKVYGGKVDYDGALQDLNTGATTPWKSKTRYKGITAEGGFGFKSQNRDGNAASAILTFGVDNWTRDLQGTGGYEEEYTLMFLRIGGESEGKRWRGRGGLLFPVDVEEHVDLFGGFDLRPDPSPWFYFGIGYRMNPQLELALDYQGYRLDNSDPVAVDVDGDGVADGVVFQPRSEQDTLTATIRVNF